MSYSEFKQVIWGILEKNGIVTKVRFYRDKETGKYMACADGITITGNSSSVWLTTRWASHTARFKVGEA